MTPNEEANPYLDEFSEPGPGLVLKQALAKRKSAGDTLTSNVVATPASVLPMAMDSYRSQANNLSDRAFKLMDSPMDYSGLQQFARQRGQQGDAAMLNAMAAQFAGESFAPLQEQLLKKASASRDPIKMAGGLITPDGGFVKDPEASQDKQVNMLLQRSAQLSQIAETADTARERIAAQRAQQELMGQLRMMGIDLQKQGLDLRRDMNQEKLDLRRYLANNKPPDNSKTWRAEDNLRSDFDKLTKDLRDELNATSKITQIVSATPPGQKPDAITQQSLVILLNKFLDPGSVVREGEFDRVVKAQGLIGKAQNLSDRILKGQPLDANTIAQINGLANLYSQAATGKIQKIADNYTEISGKRGLDVGSVISDPRYRQQGGGGPVVDFNSLPK
jgi:hypothetical protein